MLITPPPNPPSLPEPNVSFTILGWVDNNSIQSHFRNPENKIDSFNGTENGTELIKTD